MFSLKGKTAFITGSTSGIGLAIAKNYMANGATVFISGRRKEGKAIAKEIGAVFIRQDVSKEKQVIAAFEKAVNLAGKLDIVVLNAGIAEDTEGLEATPTEVMKRIIDINLYGVYYGLKYAPAQMNDGGSIIVTGSAAGSGITTFGYGEYAASKAGAAYLVRSSAIELAPRAIRVNAICPAAIAGTGMMVEDDGSETAKFYGGLTALGRMGKISEAIPLYNFLAGNGSTFITGQEIRVDGGMSAGFGLGIVNALGH